MRKVEEVVLDGYKFTITYPTGEENRKLYIDREYGSIFYEFLPQNLITTDEAEKILADYFPKLRMETVRLMREYPKFYDYFDLDERYLRGGSHTGYNDVGQKGAISSGLSLDFRLKKEFKKG